jgi:N-acetylmuramoyl-L-alanine amidase
VTNTEDLGFLTNTNKQLAMVEAIADGVFEYTHC